MDAITTPIGDVATVSCERCKRRKIKCGRERPCAGCNKAGTQCIVTGSGEKQRPVPKSYVQALERNVASLELFIQQLAAADAARRDEMLAGYAPRSSAEKTGDILPVPPASTPEAQTEQELVLARARTGQMRKLRAGKASQFFGGTSLFQIHLGDGAVNGAPTGNVAPSSSSSGPVLSPPAVCSDDGAAPSPGPAQVLYAPHDELSQRLMTCFFKEQYAYHMIVYREFFLRDYDIGAGPYYSDVLLYAICSVGALAAADPAMLSVSETFSAQAETLVYASLDKPDLTLLQALIFLGYRFIGHGKPSKGWIFCGMAFRLAHEMGLHLDPNNWNGPSEPQIDREILRRVYWAAFNVDKQLSLYFGRPPALYPHEADVRNTIRIPYPDGWQGLLETYMAKGISATAYEDGISLAGSFIYRVELYKIIGSMITDLFENRRQNADSAVLAATAQRIHVQLNKWLATLPGKLYWNQWSNGQVQPFVLHLHMVFHTAMIILHRPPRHLLSKPGIATSEDVEICYESLTAILRLLRSYAKFYKYAALPIDLVHTLSVAAGTILMKQFLESAPADDSGVAKAMDTVLHAMDDIRYTWPCIVEIRESVVRAMESQKPHRSGEEGQNEGELLGPDSAVLDFGFLADFNAPNMPDAMDLDGAGNTQVSEADLGLLLTDEYLSTGLDWNGPSLGQGMGFDRT